MKSFQYNCPFCSDDLSQNSNFASIRVSSCNLCNFKLTYVNNNYSHTPNKSNFILTHISFNITDDKIIQFNLHNQTIYLFNLKIDNVFDDLIELPWFQPDLINIQSTVLKIKAYLLLL